ncbi:MAG: hypothetical protein V3V35_02740, partial [Dehalococcoidia bacterium]
GLLLSLTGLLLAGWGALRLREHDRRRVVVPLGALVVVALPPFWDFATSGLETGLGFAWLGACFWGLARQYELQRSPAPPALGNALPRSRAPTWLAVLIGLGPLIRPDFVIFTVAFLAALLVVSPGRSWGQRLAIVAVALALPLAYQIFRMGYYAALVPNPAFAKEASASYWSQGWRYLLDLLQPYWLLVPLLGLALLAWLPAQLQRWSRRDLPGLAVAGMPVAAALVYALFITRIGGDSMHGRMLLPAVFALMLPVAVIAVSNPLQLVTALVVIPWAVISASTLRVPYETEIFGPGGIADQYAWHEAQARHPNPVTLEDYRAMPGFGQGMHARDLSATDPRVLLLGDGVEIGLASGVDASVVVTARAIGVWGYAAGPDVHVVDLLGLGDPIAGRLRLLQRARPGHEKDLNRAWLPARFGDPAARLPPDGPPTEAVAAARQALACDGPELLLDAIGQPLTPERFVRNLFLSFRLHELRIDNDPIRAVQELC